jgi:hypothetical protein
MTTTDRPQDGEKAEDRHAAVRDIPHLAAPVLTARHALAAHFLRGCPHIVEIGGYKTPITAYLTHQPQSVLSVDPKIEPLQRDELNGAPCRVRHVARKFQQVTMDLEAYSYGLVMLGYSLKPYGERQPDADQLFGLIDLAARTVIDYMIDLARPEAQLPRLLGRGTLSEVHRIDMQFHDAVIGGQPPANRRLLVLEPVSRTADTGRKTPTP